MTLGGAGMLNELRDIQVPLLAALLLMACAAKTRRTISARSVDAGISPTVLFPVHLRRPAAIGLCAAELSLGGALLVTAAPFAAGTPAFYTRVATALLFLISMGALFELRGRRPDAGCGCFGDLSHTPVGWRTLTRSGVFSAAALASVRARPLHMPSSPGQAGVLVGMVLAEVVVLGTLSPELGELMVRLGYSEPCEIRRLPVSRTLASLRISSQWRRHRRYLAATQPSDVWREGCWRYAVFPGVADGRRVDVVFAVYLKPRRPPIRAAIVDSPADQGSGGPLIPPPRPAADTRPERAVVFIPPRARDVYPSIRETR